MRVVRRRLVCMVLAGLLAACGSQPSSLPGVRFAAPPGWSVYHADSGIVRLRKSGSEALVDLAAHPLANFDALVQQYSHVALPSEVTEDM